MKAMILAAGEGTRLRPLTHCVPKPMLPVAGKPLLQHVVERLAQSGICEIVINLHHQPQAITQHFGNGQRLGVNIEYSYECCLLGTAGAVKKVEARFAEPFFVVYGDNLTTCDLDRLREFHRRRGAMATVALFKREEVSQSGVAELSGDMRIIRFIEKPLPGQTSSRWVSAGILMLEPEVMRVIPRDQTADFGRDVLPALVERGERVYGYCMNGNERLWWIDTPEDYRRVQREWKVGDVRRKVEGGRRKSENGRGRMEGGMRKLKCERVFEKSR